MVEIEKLLRISTLLRICSKLPSNWIFFTANGCLVILLSAVDHFIDYFTDRIKLNYGYRSVADLKL